MVVFGNVATILTLGFWEPFAHSATYYGTNKAVATGPGATGLQTAETRV